MEGITMDLMITVKDNHEAAQEYFELYMSIRQVLRTGKMELSDAEAYLDYKERLLSAGAKKYAQELISEIRD